MLGIADATDSVAGVVGWVDFENRDHLHHLKRLSSHPKFLGVRPMIQDIRDVDWMLREDVQWGFEAICDLDLTLDALGFPMHLDNFLTILTRYNDMRVVIDHCMKPQIRDHADGPHIFQRWADGMSRLAGDTSAYCKLSGVVTEANEDWTIGDIAPYTKHVVQEFGASLVMWGSDWPVCQLRASYDKWHETARALTEDKSSEDKARIFGGTAAEFYRLAV
jgi:L-fuconolactonase